MAATVIDALVVTLGLDPKEFKKGGDAAKKDLDEVKKKVKESGEQFKKLAGEVISFLALFTAGRGLKDFAEDVTTTNTQLERLSQNIGVSVPALKAWGNAVSLNGGTAEGFQGSLQNLSMQLTEMATTGTSQMLPYLRALHVNLRAAMQTADPLTDIMAQLAGAAEGHDRTTMHNIFKQMGFDEGSINLMLQGKQGLQEQVQKMRELYPLTEKQAKASLLLSNATSEMRLALDAMARDVMTAITPVLTDFFNGMRDGINWLRQHPAILALIGETIMTLLVPALVAATVAFWAMLGPLAPFIAIALGVSAVIALLVDDFETWRKGGISVFGGIWESFTKLLDNIKNAGPLIFAAFKSGFAHAKDAVEEALFGAKKAEAGATGAAKGAAAAVAATRSNPTITPRGVVAAGLHGAVLGLHKGLAQADQDQAMQYFQSQGWSKEQAAGIVANLRTESKFNPGAVGDSGQAYGIGQWHPDRQAEFKKFMGKDMQGSSYLDQLKFYNYELTQGNERGAGRRLRGAITAAEAGGIVSQYDERPRDRYGEASRRGALATAIAGGIPGAHLAAAVPSGAGGGVSNSKHTEVNIGTLAVHTQATDAAGIAAALPDAIRGRMLANSSDSGLD